MLTMLSYNLHVVYLVSLKVLKVKNNVRYHCYKFSNDDDDSDEEKENDNDDDADHHDDNSDDRKNNNAVLRSETVLARVLIVNLTKEVR